MNGTNSLGRIVGIIKEVAADVAAILAFIAAIIGTSKLPYPITTGNLTLVALSVSLWAWRWPRIAHQLPHVTTSELLIVGERKKIHLSFWQLLIDPFRSASLRSYTRLIFYRRSEAALLLLLTLFAIGWNSFRFIGMLEEWGYVKCTGSAKYTVAVADIGEANLENINFKKRLLEEFENQKIQNIQICNVKQSIDKQDDAQALGKRAPAAIIIWGRSDKNVFEIHVEAVSLNDSNQRVMVPPDELSTFQTTGPDRLTFLTKIILSELIYLQQGNLSEARQDLKSAIAEAEYIAEQQHWSTVDRIDLGKGYYLLGLLLFNETTESGIQDAIAAFSKAIQFIPRLDAAVLNRGVLYANLDNKEKAMADFTTLINENSPLAADAYINRAPLQPGCVEADQDLTHAVALSPDAAYPARGESRLNCGDLAGAIADLQEALKSTPDDAYLYYLLGKAYLLNNQFDMAKQTYQDAVPYLDKSTRQAIINDLQSLSKTKPELTPTINDIQKILNNAQVK